MEGQPSTSSSQYQYQSAQWSRLLRRNTLADPASNISPSIAGSSQLPTHIELLPTSILFPQHSSYHQAQLAQYNRLIAAGSTSRLQALPLPPLLSRQHIQAVPGSRSGSSGGNTARNTKTTSRGGHGNKEARKLSKGERALITEREIADKMPPKKFDLSNQLPTRPLPQHQTSTISQQSSSVPSTPHQHARKFSFESREPSPNAISSHSPRSAYSESNLILPSSRPMPPPRGGCRYETALQHTKRRMPYSLGSEKLETIPDKDVKSKLSEDEERKLSTDMRELYDRLLPTAESDSRRIKLVEKLEKLFNTEWPGHDIRVHVFGSSGNLLCTDESDVDICITTDWKVLEGVCMIADLLARSGMKEVICVSTAKVPIVKILDPELNLACDMNVNNTLALENTRMIKTYVEIDPRVRPLAMIIKHWTKRRIVNDAAFGGTLSSYTWICMIINFLQSRKPPVLPSLHQRPHLKLPSTNGSESSFADDLKALKGFGSKNNETIGQLLFNFFRFYGHEFDYDKLVLSVRNGKQISKMEKKWHLANNNTLCVEEPFNVGRNLGNTADDTSFRGLHMELRRGFDLISEGKLDECCQQYEFPKEEKPQRERKAATPKPAIIRSASQSQPHRGGRGGSHRGGRHPQQHRSSNNRRASASGTFDGHPGYLPNGMPASMSAQETWMQQQAQAQLHNDLLSTYSVLQAQENTLRMQLYQQSQVYIQAQAQNQNRNPAYAQSQTRSSGSTASLQPSDRNRTNSFDQAPRTAPLQQDQYFFPLVQYPSASSMYGGYQSSSTNPSSPSMSSAAPELRRSVHRASLTNGSGGPSSSSMRSHSQPARSASSHLTVQGMTMGSHGLGFYPSYRHVNGVPIPNFIADENSDLAFETPSDSLANTPPEATTPREYVGYYVNNDSMSSASLRRESAVPSSVPSFGEFPVNLQQDRRRSQHQLPQSIRDCLNQQRSARSPSPSPLSHERTYSVDPHSAPLTAVSSQQGVSPSSLQVLNNQVPSVVNGSHIPAPISIPQWQASVSEDSEDHVPNIDSPPLAVGSVSTLSEADDSSQLMAKEKLETRSDTPLVVNGSTSTNTEAFPTFSSPPVVNGASSGHLNMSNGLTYTEQPNGSLRLTPDLRNRTTRQAQNGGMSPLDIGSGQNESHREDLPHLSPVYETRTPSPTANRKFDSAFDRKAGATVVSTKETKIDNFKSEAKLTPTNGNPWKLPTSDQKLNGHTRGSRSEGNSPGGWQKIPKNKKKSSELHQGGIGQHQSEKIPHDNSERKGG